MLVDGTSSNASHTNGYDTQFIPTKVPKTLNFIESTYIYGKYTILENLPNPYVKKKKYHVFFSILDISLAVQSATSRGICSSENDSDPASSNKSNLNSCWIKTATILPCYNTGNKKGEKSTFPNAFGKSKVTH